MHLPCLLLTTVRGCLLCGESVAFGDNLLSFKLEGVTTAIEPVDDVTFDERGYSSARVVVMVDVT